MARGIFTVSALSLFLTTASIPTANGATGSFIVSSPDMAEPLCLTEKLIVAGAMIMEEDDIPEGKWYDPLYCNYSPPQYPASFSPFTVMPMSNSTHARLYYQIDGEEVFHIISIVYSSYLGGWTNVGHSKSFYKEIDTSSLQPGAHSLTISFRDWFGVSCYSSYSRAYGYTHGYWGDMMDQQTLTFYLPEPGETECYMPGSAHENAANPDPGSNCSNISVE